MMLWFDAASVATIAAAATCLLAAALIRARPTVRIALVVVAALMIRVDPARQSAIHQWDEQLHALVARHLMDHPSQPTLYERPVLPADPTRWT